jgi:hypothetical protein
MFPELKLFPIFPPMKGEIELLGGLIPAYPTPGIAPVPIFGKATADGTPRDALLICGIPTEGMPMGGLNPPVPPPRLLLTLPTPIGDAPIDVKPTVETGGIPIEFGTLLPNKLVTGC